MLYLVSRLQGMEEFNIGPPVVRPMDGRQPKPLSLQHVSPVPWDPNGNAAKHGTKYHAYVGESKCPCDPSATRPCGSFTEGPFWKHYKRSTNTNSRIDLFRSQPHNNSFHLFQYPLSDALKMYNLFHYLLPSAMDSDVILGGSAGLELYLLSRRLHPQIQGRIGASQILACPLRKWSVTRHRRWLSGMSVPHLVVPVVFPIRMVRNPWQFGSM